MDEEKALYLWLEGEIDQMPDIQLKVAPAMDLPQFRDRYVHPTRSYLILRVYSATDDDGQSYDIVLSPGEPAAAEAVERAQATSLTAIKGIGRRYAALLRDKANIESVEMLLAAGATPEGRAALVRQTGKPASMILRWVELADLMRIEGVGADYSALLWQAGVKSVPELARQRPRALSKTLAQANQRRKTVNRLPSDEQVQDWIEQARGLPAVVAY
ncbi:MAG: DUF4332 domain-containing protein [Anaerolineae bacterium]